MKFLDRLQPLALLILRVSLGAIMVAHGKGKIFGGMGEHYASVVKLGMPGWLAYPSAIAEFFGGILLIAGLGTRIVAIFVLVNMLVALFKVHYPRGFTGPGNYQFTLMLSAAAFVHMVMGAGAFSLDWLFGRKK